MADLGAIGILVGNIFQSKSSFALSGTVLDGGGNPACRMVRAYVRASGLLIGDTLSSPTTGAYSILLAHGRLAEECFVVEFDDRSGAQYNARILDKVLPL